MNSAWPMSARRTPATGNASRSLLRDWGTRFDSTRCSSKRCHGNTPIPCRCCWKPPSVPKTTMMPEAVTQLGAGGDATRRLTDKVVLVTGAGSGIGRAVAKHALQQGACVAMVDINESAVVEAARSEDAERVLALGADISKLAAIEDLVTRAT